jgi:hypothetical protein
LQREETLEIRIERCDDMVADLINRLHSTVIFVQIKIASATGIDSQ